MSCKSTAAQFAKAKLEQFKNLVNSPEAEKEGILPVLRRANYRIEMQGNTTHAQKGRAIISFDGRTSEAMVTLIHSSNLASC